MWTWAIAGWCVVGCTGDGTENDTTDPTTEDTESTAPCVALTEGSWSASGTCFGHDMSATLMLTGADGCTFELSAWSMAMSVPEGGTVAGEDVVFTGAGWDGCSGTTDGVSITGGCNTGCGLEMQYDG